MEILLRLAGGHRHTLPGIQALEEATENLERRGVRVVLCEARTNVLRKLVRVELVGRHVAPLRYCRDFSQALQAAEEPPATVNTPPGS
ncbi:MAG TPA: hypothetical protein VGD47_06890 [Steroidobacteraceae bacterium]